MPGKIYQFKGKKMENELSVFYQREYKDRLFKFIFGRESDESKKWRLQLYNALNGTNYDDPDELKINTIENVIYISMHNDISFLIDSEMDLYEQQSSQNPNMPLRGLFYFSLLYQGYIKENELNILSNHLVQIPTPRFIVFYNGPDKNPDSWKFKLSDAFMQNDDSGDFEWTATVININDKHNQTLYDNCNPLYDYVRYIGRIKSNIKSGMVNDKAIDEAIDFAIKHNYLQGFFEKHRAEVRGMCLTEFDVEEFKKVCRNDGYIDGREEGKKEKAEEAAIAFLKKDFPPETIAECEGLPLERVLELQKSIKEMA